MRASPPPAASKVASSGAPAPSAASAVGADDEAVMSKLPARVGSVASIRRSKLVFLCYLMIGGVRPQFVKLPHAHSDVVTLVPGQPGQRQRYRRNPGNNEFCCLGTDGIHQNNYLYFSGRMVPQRLQDNLVAIRLLVLQVLRA